MRRLPIKKALGGLPMVLSVVLVAACSPEVQQDASVEPRRESVVGSDGPASEEPITDRGDELAKLADGAHGVTSTKARLAVRPRPRKKAPKDTVAMANPLDQKVVMLVRGARSNAQGEWLKVLLPERPNGSTGWVGRDAVEVVRLRHRIEVDLSDYRLEFFRGEKRLHSFTVGIGRDAFPSPTGTYYVWAKVPQPSPAGPYGIYALAISGFSPVLRDWPGGGRAGVHGTANQADKGEKVSLGCVRVFNEDMKKLTGVPMGTPVVIER